MAGIYETDWSWTPLVTDFDNDGYRDLFITNGYPRDVTDLDHALYNGATTRVTENTSLMSADSLPIVKSVSYAFKNTGGYMFENKTADWGITKPAFSNGAVYADLDNDGDMDMVISNIDDGAFVYENTTNSKNHVAKNHNYLALNLVGKGVNTEGIGAKVRIYYGGKQQFYEHEPCRGYMSTDDPKAHFGLGNTTKIDSLNVVWNDGNVQNLKDLKVNQTLTLNYKNSVKAGTKKAMEPQSIFKSVGTELGVNFKHQEKDAIDYNIQPLLPHKLSQYGPAIAVGDIDNNGYDDFFVGGPAGKQGTFYMQDKNGKFTRDDKRFIDETYKDGEDMGALLFDYNNDGFPDLYITSGSYEFQAGATSAQDRLYLNDGNGHFKKDLFALPNEYDNGSCVRAADFDRDGYLDLFVGGRSVSGAYPSAPQSHLLHNEHGRFTDVTKQLCPELEHIGMVTDALWTDFNNDGLVDLVVTGEWMPVTFFKNTGHGFVKLASSGIEQHTGWWNSIVAGDFDNDGDMDYVAGNLGLNSNFKATFKEPMTIIAKDIDTNGSYDAMIFCYLKAVDGTMRPFPMHTRDDMISQLISTRKKYPTYKSFGTATMEDLWSGNDLKGALKLQATDMNTSYIENKGGRFTIKPMPLEAQMAPVYGMVTTDVDHDGIPDLLMVGNDYGMEPFTGRHDAFMGLYLKGDGKGGFSPQTITKSGFYVKGDGKALAVIHSAQNKDLLIASQNQDSLKVFSPQLKGGNNTHCINLKPQDFFADVTYKNGKKKHLEFYYGSTFLSQSTRKVAVDDDVASVFVTDYKGVKRQMK